MLRLFKRKAEEFFSHKEKEKILSAVQSAEKQTSGEIRVFVESKCRFVDAIDRAAEIFYSLRMNETDDRNAVLLYIALKHRQLAIFADEGIYQKTGKEFWNKKVHKMLSHFNKQNYAEGIAEVVKEIGEELALHFPFDASTNKNQLPDDIVFGK